MPTIDDRGILGRGPFSDFKCAHKHWTLAPIYRKSTVSGVQNFVVAMELLNNAHDIRQMVFGDLPQIRK